MVEKSKPIVFSLDRFTTAMPNELVWVDWGNVRDKRSERARKAEFVLAAAVAMQAHRHRQTAGIHFDDALRAAHSVNQRLPDRVILPPLYGAERHWRLSKPIVRDYRVRRYLWDRLRPFKVSFRLGEYLTSLGTDIYVDDIEADYNTFAATQGLPPLAQRVVDELNYDLYVLSGLFSCSAVGGFDKLRLLVDANKHPVVLK